MSSPTWYKWRMRLYWTTGVVGVVWAIFVVLGFPMVINGTLEPEYWMLDICITTILGILTWAWATDERDENRTPIDRTKES